MLSCSISEQNFHIGFLRRELSTPLFKCDMKQCCEELRHLDAAPVPGVSFSRVVSLQSWSRLCYTELCRSLPKKVISWFRFPFVFPSVPNPSGSPFSGPLLDPDPYKKYGSGTYCISQWEDTVPAPYSIGIPVVKIRNVYDHKCPSIANSSISNRFDIEPKRKRPELSTFRRKEDQKCLQMSFSYL